MNKEHILSEIKRLTSENDGVAPGMKTFAAATGIVKSEWYPSYWLRWSDAIKEAGCEPNTFDNAYGSEFIITKHIELIRELNHFPIEGELQKKRKEDKSFPGTGAIYNFGNKQERIEKIIKFCQGKDEYNDIIEICSKVKVAPKLGKEKPDDGNNKIGYVYLVQHGSRNEYKIGMTTNPIRREGELRIELPEKIKPIHYIETDDPAGVENYWHRRFSDKRKEGEWFTLNADDVRAFKRWRKIA